MNGHFLPHLSAARPKVMAPTLRSISTSVMPHVMSFFERSNWAASEETVRETVKKSNASLWGPVSWRCAESDRQTGSGHAPSPSDECDEEEAPVMPGKSPKHGERVRRDVSGRFEGGESRNNVPTSAHTLSHWIVGGPVS